MSWQVVSPRRRAPRKEKFVRNDACKQIWPETSIDLSSSLSSLPTAEEGASSGRAKIGVSPIPFTPFPMKSATDTALLERQRVDNRLHPRQRNTFNAGNRLASLLSYSSTLSLPPSFLIFLSFLLLFLLEVYLSIGLYSWIDRIFDKVSFQSVLLRSRGDCLGRRPQRTVSIPSFDSWLFTWEH